MKINFYPDHDDPNFEKAAKKYAEIWNQEGNRIIRVLEKISGLKFKEEIINAITYNENSYSIPLRLQSNSTKREKKWTIVHELCHRLFVANNIKLNNLTWDNHNLETHKPVDLILYDVLVELYGEKEAKDNIKYEIDLWTGKNVSPYKIAWDWALSMTKEERAKEFRKYFEFRLTRRAKRV